MPYVEYDEVEAICADCGRIFRSEDALAAHREESHSGGEFAAAPPSSDGLKCLVCGRIFDSPTMLRAHSAKSHPTR